MFAQSGTETGRTVLLIAAPSDAAIFDYFRALAGRWPTEIQAERLIIQGEVSLVCGLRDAEASPAIRRVLSADMQLISRIELEFPGLKMSYVRSGGHGPTVFRDSFFDELHLDLQSAGNELIAQLALSVACTKFEIQAVRSDLDLSPLVPISQIMRPYP
jgi:hypothetical protein